MKTKTLFNAFVLMVAILLAACNVDKEITATPVSVIKVEGRGVYELKVGGEVVISPAVEYADGAEFE